MDIQTVGTSGLEQVKSTSGAINVTPRTAAFDGIAATVVPNATTTMLVLDVRGLRRVFISLVGAVAALTEFKVFGAAAVGGTPVSLLAAAADYTTPKFICVVASGDLTILPVGTGWAILNVEGIAELTIKAKSGGTATLAIAASGS